MSRYGLPDMFEAVFKALNDRGVRFLVVGGVAVVLHGYVRITMDLDLVVDLDEEHAFSAIEALTELGLQPRLPVDPRQFADGATREKWIREKGMAAFTLLDPDQPTLVVDLFTELPQAFEELWERATQVDLDTTSLKIMAIDDLIAMKREAGRPKDLLDVAELEAIKELQRTERRDESP